jgi:hypothetical protein
MGRKATASTINSNTNDQTTDKTYQITEYFIAASNRQDNIKMGLRKTMLQEVDYIYLGTMSDACD